MKTARIRHACTRWAPAAVFGTTLLALVEIHETSEFVNDSLFVALLAVAFVLFVGIDVYRRRMRTLSSELGRAAEHQRVLLANMPLLTYVVDAEQDKLVWISPQIEQFSGYTAEEWLTRAITFPEVLHPDDREETLRRREASFIGDGPDAHEFRFVRRDGAVIWLHDQAIVVRGDDGEPLYMQGFAIDITERKRAEEELARATERYRLIVETAEEGVWLVDAEDRTTFVNPKMAEMLGRTVDDMLGRSLFDFMDDAGRKQAAAKMAERRDGVRGQHEFTYVRADGTLLHALLSANPIHDEDGSYAGGLAMVTDITARKEAEATREYLAAIVASSHSAIFGTTLDGRIHSWNVGGEEIYGYTVEEAKQLKVEDLVPPDLMHEVEKFRHAVLEKRVPRTWETTRIRKNGERFAASVTLSPIFDRYGTVTGVSKITRDVSDQKHLEEQLRQKQKMEAIGQLAGGVAHDFNNSLMAIRGYADLMLSRIAEDDPLYRHAAGIKKAADGATATTRQLLAFGRRQMLQPRILDLNQVVGDLGDLLRRVIGEDVDLELELDPAIGLVEADPGQIEQTLVNLAVNARDAMPQGGLLTISTENADFDGWRAESDANVPPGSYVLVTVSDTGCGMTTEVRERIFDPFFTTKEPGKGTGMGLSTVYGIVKQSGGHIWAYSDPGTGTAMKIYLPRVAKAVPAPAQPQEATLPTGDETVLLVEDADAVRTVVSAMLSGLGYGVLEAATPADAIALCSRRDCGVDLLLTDIVMPQVDGSELAARILELRPATKTLFMSGYTDLTGHRGILDESADFLQKPFSVDALARKLREVLDRDAAVAA